MKLSKFMKKQKNNNEKHNKSDAMINGDNSLKKTLKDDIKFEH